MLLKKQYKIIGGAKPKKLSPIISKIIGRLKYFIISAVNSETKK